MLLSRRDLQQLARTRLREARVLLRQEEYEGGYYLTGLAVECALKACIARKTKRFDFPDLNVVKESYTHDLTNLLKIAGLQADRDRDAQRNRLFDRNWAVVKDWKVESRYTVNGATKAQDLFNAVSRGSHGVFAWIRQRW